MQGTSSLLRLCPSAHASVKSKHCKRLLLKEDARLRLQYTSNARVHKSHFTVSRHPICCPRMMHSLRLSVPSSSLPGRGSSTLRARCACANSPTLSPNRHGSHFVPSRRPVWYPGPMHVLKFSILSSRTRKPATPSSLPTSPTRPARFCVRSKPCKRRLLPERRLGQRLNAH